VNYATEEEFREYVGLAVGVGDTAAINDVLDVASRWVDAYCARNFDSTADTATARVFPANGAVADVDDFATTSGLVVETSGDRSSWTTVDAGTYYAGPDSAAVRGRPWTRVELAAGVFSAWVRVTAKWGWTATPPQVTRATLMRAHWFAKRKDSPYGIEGFDGFALRVSSAGDPDVRALLATYRRGDRVFGIA